MNIEALADLVYASFPIESYKRVKLYPHIIHVPNDCLPSSSSSSSTHYICQIEIGAMRHTLNFHVTLAHIGDN